MGHDKGGKVGQSQSQTAVIKLGFYSKCSRKLRKAAEVVMANSKGSGASLPQFKCWPSQEMTV